MGLMDYIILAVVVLLVAAAAFFIFRAKKNGQKCIGCPHSSCGGNCCCGEKHS